MKKLWKLQKNNKLTIAHKILILLALGPKKANILNDDVNYCRKNWSEIVNNYGLTNKNEKYDKLCALTDDIKVNWSLTGMAMLWCNILSLYYSQDKILNQENQELWNYWKSQTDIMPKSARVWELYYALKYNPLFGYY